jgi:hypothetical protein
MFTTWCAGISRRKLGKLIEELAQPRPTQQESRLRDRRGRDRLRAEVQAPAMNCRSRTG